MACSCVASASFYAIHDIEPVLDTVLWSSLVPRLIFAD